MGTGLQMHPEGDSTKETVRNNSDNSPPDSEMTKVEQTNETKVVQDRWVEASSIPLREPECVPEKALAPSRERGKLPPIKHSARVPSIEEPVFDMRTNSNDDESEGINWEEALPPPLLGKCKSWKWQKMIEWSQEQGFSPSETEMQANLTSEEKKIWLDFFVEQYMQSTRADGDMIDSLLNEAKRKQNLSAGMFFVPFPIFSAQRTTLYKFFIFLFAAISWTFMIIEICAMTSDHKHRACSFRFTSTSSRGSLRPPMMLNVAELQVTESQCTHPPSFTNASSHAVTITYAPRSRGDCWTLMDGFSYVTSGSDPALDPTVFTVERLTADQRWEKIQRPLSVTSGALWRAHPPERRGERVEVRGVDSRLWYTVALFGVLAGGSSLALFFAVTEHFFMAREVISHGIAASAAVLWVGAVRHTLDRHDFHQCATWWRGVLVASVLSLSLALRGKVCRLAVILAVTPVLDCGVMLSLLAWVPAEGGEGRWALGVAYAGPSVALPLVLVVCGAGLLARRMLLLATLRRRGAEDMRRCDAIWEEIELEAGGGPGARGEARAEGAEGAEGAGGGGGGEGRKGGRALEEGPSEMECFLKAMARLKEPLDRVTLLLQRVQPEEEEESMGFARRESVSGQHWQQELGGLVQSLDQLYAQAACASRLLREEVRRLALENEIMFPTSPPRQLRSDPPRKYDRWDMLCARWGPELAASKVCWAEVKPVERAISKVLRRYDGEVCRLLDVCRETLVFESVAAMAACLEDLAASPSVAVERVRSSMVPGVDASQWTGFRQVVVNLRFTTPVATGLGVAGHVCELVLLLHSFAVLQSVEAHKDYVKLRNLDNAVGRRVDSPSLRVRRSISGVVSLIRRSSSRSCEPRAGMRRVASTSFALPSFPISGSAEDAAVDEQFSILLACYRRRALCPSGVLDRRKCCIQGAAAKAELLSLFQTSYPIAAALSKARFRWLLLPLAAAFIMFATGPFYDRTGQVSSARVRFRAVELRGGKGVRPGPGEEIVSSVGMLHQGCHRRLEDAGVSGDGMTWSFRAGEEAMFTGFYFITWEGAPRLDPTVFAFEALLDGEWTVVGTSSKTVEQGGAVGWRLGVFDTPLDRGAVVEVSLTVPYSLWLLEVVLNLALAAVCLLIFVLGAARRYMLGRPVLVGGALLLALLTALKAIFLALESAHHTFPLHALYAAMFAACAAALVFRERYIIEVVSCAALAFGVSGELALHAMPSSRPPHPAMRVFPFLLLLLGLSAWVLRRLLRRRVHREFVQGHLEKYHAAWAAVLALPANAAALSDISRTLAGLHRPATLVQQMHAPPPFDTAAPSLSGSSSPLARRLGSPFSFSPPRSVTRRSAPRLSARLLVAKGTVAPAPLAEAELGAGAVEEDAGRGAGSEVERLEEVLKRERMRCFYLANAEERAGAWSSFSASLTLRVNTFARSAPITSLDLLYAQAVGLHPLLKRKVQEWALASGGVFPLRADEEGGKRWVKWADAVREREAQLSALREAHGGAEEGAVLAIDRIKWAAVKSPERAIEKLVRVYRGKVALLLDVCRQNIVFESCEELAKCLRLISRDRHAIVLGYKNRLREDYDSALSGGYRDVQLKLVLVTKEAEKLGLSHHVCEVQLLLREFADIKNDIGHKKYVEARDAKAE